jgi:hypothetical protein
VKFNEIVTIDASNTGIDRAAPSELKEVYIRREGDEPYLRELGIYSSAYCIHIECLSSESSSIELSVNALFPTGLWVKHQRIIQCHRPGYAGRLILKYKTHPKLQFLVGCDANYHLFFVHTQDTSFLYKNDFPLTDAWLPPWPYKQGNGYQKGNDFTIDLGDESLTLCMNVSERVVDGVKMYSLRLDKPENCTSDETSLASLSGGQSVMKRSSHL